MTDEQIERLDELLKTVMCAVEDYSDYWKEVMNENKDSRSIQDTE
jgi:archaellum component FlaC